MAGPDLSVFHAIKTKADYDRLEEEFQLKKLQALQSKQGSTPAALQLANEYLAAKQGGDIDRANAIESFAKTHDKNVFFDPAHGGYVPLPGMPGALGALEYGKQSGKETAMDQHEPGRAGAVKQQQLAQELDYGPDIKEQTDLAAGRAERQQNYSKAKSALTGFKQQSDLVTKTIDDALAKISPWSTGYGSYLSGLPNTDAGELRNFLDTVKANVGFDKLQSMRENSPTGGALGQVSDMENRLLQAVNGALDPKQSKQLAANLAVIKELYPKVLAEKEAAFMHDYGEFEGYAGQAPAIPPMSGKKVKIVHPQTGEQFEIDESDLPFAQAEGFKRW